MGISRRDFLRTVAIGGTTLLAGDVRAEHAARLNCDKTFGVLVDTGVCIGCRKCEWACSKKNFNPEADPVFFDDKNVFKDHRRPNALAYTVVNEFRGPEPGSHPFTMKVQCMHCNDPACVSACIVGALKKCEFGPVTYDASKCIGCRYCMVACPFQIPAYEYFNAFDPQVRKCSFCYDRIVEERKRPACVEVCPSEALTFGTRRELIDMAHSRIRAHPERYVDHVYGELELGGTSWMYLSPIDFKYTELPDLPDQPAISVSETIQHGIFKQFVPPLMLYGLLGLVMTALREKEEKKRGHHE
jgi:Fe-S-cluster-containing dehydrogenase component